MNDAVVKKNNKHSYNDLDSTRMFKFFKSATKTATEKLDCFVWVLWIFISTAGHENYEEII